jgi:hypothetical protein
MYFNVPLTYFCNIDFFSRSSQSQLFIYLLNLSIGVQCMNIISLSECSNYNLLSIYMAI